MIYEILEADSAEEMQSMIDSYAKSGWKAQGGLSVVMRKATLSEMSVGRDSHIFVYTLLMACQPNDKD